MCKLCFLQSVDDQLSLDQNLEAPWRLVSCSQNASKASTHPVFEFLHFFAQYLSPMMPISRTVCHNRASVNVYNTKKKTQHSLQVVTVGTCVLKTVNSMPLFLFLEYNVNKVVEISSHELSVFIPLFSWHIAVKPVVGLIVKYGFMSTLRKK